MSEQQQNPEAAPQPTQFLNAPGEAPLPEPGAPSHEQASLDPTQMMAGHGSALVSALLQRLQEGAVPHTISLLHNNIDILRDREGERPIEYLRQVSVTAADAGQLDLPEDYQQVRDAVGGVPITTMDPSGGPNRIYPEVLSKNKTWEGLVPRYAGQTPDEALARAAAARAKSASDLTAQLASVVQEALPTMTLGFSNVPPSAAQGGPATLPLLGLSAIKMITDAYAKGAEGNASLQDADRTYGQIVGLALWAVTPPGAVFKAIQTSAAPLIERGLAPLVSRVGASVVKTMGERATVGIFEGAPALAGAPQTGNELMQGLMGAIEKAGQQGGPWSPLSWAANKVGQRAISKIPPSTFGALERVMGEVAGAGGRVELSAAGEVTVRIPAEIAKGALGEQLRTALRALKGAMTQEGAIVTFKISTLAVQTGADIAGMMGLTALRAGSASAEPGATPGSVGKGVLASLPTDILFPAVMRLSQVGGMLSPTYPNLKKGWVLGQRSGPADPFRTAGPVNSNAPASQRLAYLPPPEGATPEVSQAIARVQEAYRSSPNPSISDSIAKTTQALIAQTQLPAPPALPPDAPPEMVAQLQQITQQAQQMAQDVPAHLTALAELAGHPALADASRLLGVDAEALLLGNAPAPWPLVRYAVALAEQAGSLEGYALPTQPFSLPELVSVAQQILAKKPEAAVGLPPELQAALPKIPTALLSSPPATPTSHALPPVDRATLTLRDAPDEAALDSDPSAIGKMTALLDSYSQGSPMLPLGTLFPSNPSALVSSDPQRVNLYLDDGLIKAEVPNAAGETTLIDVTHSLEPAALPADAGWTLKRSVVGPIAVRLTDSGRFVIDPTATGDLIGAQAALRERVNDERGSPIDPFTQPGSLLEAAHHLTFDNKWGAEAVVAAAERLRANHVALFPMREEVLAPANDRQRDEEWGERISQHLQEAAKIEAAHAVATEALTEKRGNTALRTAFGNESVRRFRTAWALFDSVSDQVTDPVKYARLVQVVQRHIDEGLRLDLQREATPKWAEDAEPPAPAEGLSEPRPTSLKSEDESGNVRAVAGMDPRILKVLGGNLYSGDLGTIAVKEMLQNAIDGLRALPEGQKGSIDLAVDVNARTIRVSDTGIGMSPEVATQQLVDIGGTYKPGAASSGGYGIAKVAIFTNANDINIITDDGTTQTVLTGSGEDWLDPNKGLKVTSLPSGPQASRVEIFNPRTGVVVETVASEDAAIDWLAEHPDRSGLDYSTVPGRATTGTSIEVTLKPEAAFSWHRVQTFLKNLLSAPSLPFEITANLNGALLTPGSVIAILPEHRITLPVGTLDEDGFTADVLASSTSQERGSIDVAILNNGIYQFDHTVYLGQPVKAPSSVTIDIHSKASPDTEDYPFRPDREGLRGDASDAISTYINTKFVQDAIKDELEGYRKAYASAPRVKYDPTESHIYDTANEHPPALIAKIAENEDFGEFCWHLRTLFERVRKTLAIQDPYLATSSSFDGIGLGSGYQGVNLPGKYVSTEEAGTHNRILLNPMTILDGLRFLVAGGTLKPEEAAREFVVRCATTLVHEITHDRDRSHYESYSSLVTTNLGVMAHPDVVGFIDFFTEGLRRNSNELYDAILAIKRDLDEVRTAGEDVFSKISTSFAGPSEPNRGEGAPDSSSPGGGKLEADLRDGGPYPSKLVAPGSPPGPSGPPDPAALAREASRLHVEALDYAANGGSFSKRPKLFAALTPDEKYEAALARLLTGDIVSSVQLKALNPSLGGPSYWAGWKPTPDQATKLQTAWEHARDKAGDRDKALTLATEVAEKRGIARSSYVATGDRTALNKIEREGIIPFDQLKTITAADWKALAKHNPHIYAEFIGQFNRERSSLSRTAEEHGATQTLNLLEDAFEAILENPEITSLDALPPEALKTKNMFEHMSATSTLQAMLTKISRPFQAIGSQRQLSIQQMRGAIDSGVMDRDPYEQIRGGVIDQLDRARSDEAFYDPLHRVEAYAPPDISNTITVLLHRALWQGWTPETLAQPKYEWKVPLSPLGMKGATTTIRLSEWVPKIRARLDAAHEAMTPVLIAERTHDQVTARKVMNTIEAEIHARILKHAATTGTEVAALSDLPPETIAALRIALRASDKGDDAAEDFEAMSFKELERTLASRTKGWAKLQKEIETLERGAKYRENYTPLIYNRRVKEEIADAVATKSDPYLLQLSRQNPDIFFRFLEERTENEQPPIEDFFYTNRLYNYGLNRFVALQPRLTKALDLVSHPDYPVAQRDYTLDMVGLLKGIPRPEEALLENHLREALLKNPSLWKDILKKVKGIDADEVVKKYGDRALPARASHALTRALLPAIYTTFISLRKTALFNLAEIAYILPELAKNSPDLLHGVVDIPIAAAQALGARTKEFWARRMATLFGRRGWYQYQSEATKAHVTDLVNEVNTHLAEVSRITKESGSASGKRAALILDTYMSLSGVKPTEAITRTIMFNILVKACLRAGLTLDEAHYEAAKRVEYMQGAFHTAAWAPVFASQNAKLLMPLQRYPGIRTGPYLAQWRMLLEGMSGLGPKRKIGPVAQPEAELPPLSEQPPLTDGEREAWHDVHTPPAEHGTGFAAGSGSAMRAARYLAAVHLTLAYILWPIGEKIYSFLGLNPQKAWDYVDPYFMRDASTIFQGLIGDASNVAHTFTNPGSLTPKQRKDRNMSAARLAAYGASVATLGAAGVVTGPWLRSQYKPKPKGFDAGPSFHGF